MSGISYDPPLEQLAIFDPSVFIYDQNLSSTTSGGTFLNFPIAQGTETFIDLISNGTATLNTATVSNQLIATCPIVVADVFPAPTQTAVLTASQLTFSDASTTNTILLDDTQILLASTATPNSIDIKNNVMTLTNVSGSNLLTADSWTGNIASVNTSANLTHYLGFFDSSGTGSGKPQKTASLSCNPATGLITATTFSGALSGNATSATSVNTANDNSNTAYNLVFCAGASATSNLLIDSITAPLLTYNPSSGNISTTSITADIQCSSTTASASFLGTTLTFSGSNLTLRNGTITFTGTSNTVATLNLSSNRNNAMYNIGIRNNGSLATSFLTGLGANILTTYSATVVIPSSSSALMRIIVLTLAGVSTSIVSIDLLT